jgi:acetyltransferase
VVTIRPIRPEDEPLIVRFHGMLSDDSVYSRYMAPLQLAQRVAHERLTRVCFIDYDREMAFVAERKSASGGPEIIGVGRLVKSHGVNEAEFALLVADTFQGSGLGTQLLRRLIQFARDEKLEKVVGSILPSNRRMLQITSELGFEAHHSPDGGPVMVELDIRASQSKSN